MKSRRLPLWLLRDVPAFLGVMISFWPLMILVIRNGFAAMRGKRIAKSVFDMLPILLAHAESRLDFALWREAYRRLGWNPRLVQFQLFPSPETWADTATRFESYRRACMDLEACVRLYADDLRTRHNISQRQAANARSCSLRLATRSTSRGFAEAGNAHRSFSSSSAQHWWRRHALARDGGGSRSCRGPPPHLQFRKSANPTSQALPARPQAHASGHHGAGESAEARMRLFRASPPSATKRLSHASDQ